jgi:hypothetical protein
MNVEIGTETPIFLFWEYLKLRYFVFAVCGVNNSPYGLYGEFSCCLYGKSATPRITYTIQLLNVESFNVESLNAESFIVESLNAESFNVESFNSENHATANHTTAKIFKSRIF